MYIYMQGVVRSRPAWFAKMHPEMAGPYIQYGNRLCVQYRLEKLPGWVPASISGYSHQTDLGTARLKQASQETEVRWLWEGPFYDCVDTSVNGHGLVVEGQVTASRGSGIGRSRDLDDAGVRAVSVQLRDVSFTSGSPLMYRRCIAFLSYLLS